MPQVPSYQRSETDRPIFQQGVTTRATPDDMGAAVGRGLAAGAQALGQASDAMAAVRDLEDMTAAKEADNRLAEWSRNAMYGDGGFMTLEGRAAVDARSKFEQQWEEQRRLFGQDLKSPGAGRQYAEASGARFQSVKESVIVHQANERKSWIKTASAARVKMFADDALAAFGDPNKVERSIAAGQAELRQQGALEGWDADTLRFKEEEFISGVHHDIAMRKAVDDPLAAQQYLEDHREALSGAHQFDLENTLETSVTTERAKQAAAAIMDQIEAGDGDIETMLDAIEDPDVRDLARTAVAGALQQQAKAEEAQKKALQKQAADLVFKEGASPLTFPPEVQAALGQDGMKELMGTWEMLQNGPTVTDPALKYELYQQSAADPVEFAKRDLLAERRAGRLSEQDFEQFASKQAEIGKGKDIALTTAFSQANDALVGIGLDLTGLSGDKRTEMAGRIAEFQNVLAAQIEEYKAAHDGQNPDQAETQAMINRLLLPVVISTPKDFWGLDPTAVFGGQNKRDGLLFEAGTRPDGATVDVAVKYEDIPTSLRQGIRADLERQHNRKVSDEEVANEYERFLLSE
jgi:hypothetical protein